MMGGKSLMKLHLLLTEYKPNLRRLGNKFFKDYTLINRVIGIWEAVEEKSSIFLIVTSDSQKVEALKVAIKKANNQTSILHIIFKPFKISF